jgi:hypothetical protein
LPQNKLNKRNVMAYGCIYNQTEILQLDPGLVYIGCAYDGTTEAMMVYDTDPAAKKTVAKGAKLLFVDQKNFDKFRKDVALCGRIGIGHEGSVGLSVCKVHISPLDLSTSFHLNCSCPTFL